MLLNTTNNNKFNNIQNKKNKNKHKFNIIFIKTCKT